MILDDIRRETRTILIYESPHHLKKTLSELMEITGEERRVVLCRELTKLHEEILRMTMKEICDHYDDKEPRGEYVLVLEGRSEEKAEDDREKNYGDMSIQDHVRMYEEKGFDKKEAIKRTALDRGIPKREVYRVINIKDEE